jgi:hypothetical protein
MTSCCKYSILLIIVENKNTVRFHESHGILGVSHEALLEVTFK